VVEKLSKKISLNIYDLDTFWFYLMIKLPQHKNDMAGYDKYRLHLSEIFESIPDVPNLPSWYIYVDKEHRMISIIDFYVGADRFRFRSSKSLKFDPKRFGYVDEKYHTWNCEKANDGITELTQWFTGNSNDILGALLGGLMTQMGMDFGTMMMSLNEEATPQQEMMFQELMKNLSPENLNSHTEKIKGLLNQIDMKV